MARLPSLTRLALAGCLLAGCDGPRLPAFLGRSNAQKPDEAQKVDPAVAQQAQALVANAVATLESRQSAIAKIRLSVNLFGKQLVGSGLYLEQNLGRGRLMRMELTVQAAEQTGTLLQVCDGRQFWTYLKLGSEQKLERIDMERAATAITQAQSSGRMGPFSWPSMGGLPKLLEGLRDAFQFDSAEPGQLLGLPVWRLQGRWRPERLAKFLPEQKKAIQAGAAVNLKLLPAYLPDHVVLLVGQEDLFPYRVEYRRLGDKQLGAGGPDDSSQLMLAVQFAEVSLNVPIDAAHFSYHPGELQPVDLTASFLQSLGLSADK